VGRPEEVLAGHQMRGAVLQLCGVLARNLFACSLTQMRQALSKLKAQGATITRIRRYVQVLESPGRKAVLADKFDLAQSVEGACVSRSRLPADGAERRHSAICREFMRELKVPKGSGRLAHRAPLTLCPHDTTHHQQPVWAESSTALG